MNKNKEITPTTMAYASAEIETKDDPDTNIAEKDKLKCSQALTTVMRYASRVSREEILEDIDDSLVHFTTTINSIVEIIKSETELSQLKESRTLDALIAAKVYRILFDPRTNTERDIRSNIIRNIELILYYELSYLMPEDAEKL